MGLIAPKPTWFIYSPALIDLHFCCPQMENQLYGQIYRTILFIIITSNHLLSQAFDHHIIWKKLFAFRRDLWWDFCVKLSLWYDILCKWNKIKTSSSSSSTSTTFWWCCLQSRFYYISDITQLYDSIQMFDFVLDSTLFDGFWWRD